VQDFLTNVSGRLFAAPRLTKKLRSFGQSRMVYRQYSTVDPQFGKHQGDQMYFAIRTDLDADPSDGLIVAERTAIPEAEFKILRGTVTCELSARQVRWTEQFETYSELGARQPIEESMGDLLAKGLNYRVYTQLADTNVLYIPTGTTDNPTSTWDTDGTASTAATRNIQVFDLKAIMDAMAAGLYGTAESAPVEYYDGSSNMGIFSVWASRAIKDDPEWEDAQHFGDPRKLFIDEQGKIANVRCTVDNHILGKINGFGGGAFIFGKDPCMEIISLAEEMRVGIPANFGFDMGIAGVYMGGFKNPFLYNATAGDDQLLDNRVVMITSS
jgi:hypothetical protein